ncbi:HAX1 protein, partial [Ptilonorhynchus violaceus]|nr:HAX1 protein [Ptilonorhynchus violaceus]
MSFYDLFRGFFGFPGRCRPRDPLFGGTAWDEEKEDGGSSMAQPSQDFGFGFSPGLSRGAFEELFRDVGELLGVLGESWAGPPQPYEPDEGSAGRPLRDSMLKHPESPPASAAPANSGSASD